MAQPSEAQSKLIDKNGNFQLGNRGNSITAPVSTASAANVSHSTASFADVDTALNALGVIINALRTDRDDLIVRTGQLIERGEAHGLWADN